MRTTKNTGQQRTTVKLAMTLAMTLIMTSFRIPPWAAATSYNRDVQDFSVSPSVAGMMFADLVVWSSGCQSVVQCAGQCARHSCNMFTFTETLTFTDNCRCHSKVMTSHNPSATPSVGTVVYVPTVYSDWLESGCLTDWDCPRFATCFNNVCVCPYDTYYSDSLRLCIAHCPDNLLGSRFLPYYQTALRGHNHALYYFSAVVDCFAVCVSATSYVCRSVEWEYNNLYCLPQYTDLAESPSTTLVNISSWTLYQRSCA